VPSERAAAELATQQPSPFCLNPHWQFFETIPSVTGSQVPVANPASSFAVKLGLQPAINLRESA